MDEALASFLKKKDEDKLRKRVLKDMLVKTLFVRPTDAPGAYSYFKGTDTRVVEHCAKKYPDATIITADKFEWLIERLLNPKKEEANA